MGKKTKPSVRICSLLMACLLALSASVQFNDSDWYFWFPLYTCGCIVNFVNGLQARKSPNIVKPLAKFTLWIGLLLFVKVVFEDRLRNEEVSGFWSVDMRERVVREKIGSGLVIGSMALQLKNPKPANNFKYGMAVMVGIGYGLSLFFLSVPHERDEILNLNHRIPDETMTREKGRFVYCKEAISLRCILYPPAVYMHEETNNCTTSSCIATYKNVKKLIGS